MRILCRGLEEEKERERAELGVGMVRLGVEDGVLLKGVIHERDS